MVVENGSNQFSPVGRDGIQHIVNLACESDLGHRQREARGLLNCRSRWHKRSNSRMAGNILCKWRLAKWVIGTI